MRAGLSLMAARWRAVRPSGSRVMGSTAASSSRWETTCSFSCHVASNNIGPRSLPAFAIPVQQQQQYSVTVNSLQQQQKHGVTVHIAQQQQHAVTAHSEQQQQQYSETVHSVRVHFQKQHSVTVQYTVYRNNIGPRSLPVFAIPVQQQQHVVTVHSVQQQYRVQVYHSCTLYRNNKMV